MQQEQNQYPRLNKIEGFLKLVTPSLLIFLPYNYSIILFILINIMALIRSYGYPQMNKEYLQKLLPSEFFCNLVYLGILTLMNLYSLLFFLPLVMHAVSGACQFEYTEKLLQKKFSQYQDKILHFVETVRKNRNDIIIIKNKIEIALFLYLLFKVIIFQDVLEAIAYYQFLILKIKSNKNILIAEKQIDDMILKQQGVIGIGLMFVWKGFKKLLRLF